MNRREFLAMAAGSLLPTKSAIAQESAKADITLRIGPLDLEIAPKRVIKTIGYNGSVPGPVLRMTEGRPVTIDVFNDSAAPELVHWHGLFIPSNVDGSMEEGTPMIAPKGHQRYSFTPRPAGTRWYHTHTFAGRNLKKASYTGQFGVLLIDSAEDRGAYDQEVILALHGWDPYMTSMDDGSLEVAYRWHTINSHCLGSGEPVRVKQGQRVLFRIVNASATGSHRLALSGHRMTVVALDGYAVPTPHAVDVIDLAPAERADVLVEMNQPGVWILGEVDEKTRQSGLGIVVEYSDRKEASKWLDPPVSAWDYTVFGKPAAATEADERIPLVFKAKWMGNKWEDHWTINGKEFPHTDTIAVKSGARYRLVFDNQSDDAHPVHLHRHAFELVSVAGKQTAGVMKDVVMCPARKQVEAQFVADNPGPTLFHCHQQFHMDFGFMALMEYDGAKAPAASMRHA